MSLALRQNLPKHVRASARRKSSRAGASKKRLFALEDRQGSQPVGKLDRIAVVIQCGLRRIEFLRQQRHNNHRNETDPQADQIARQLRSDDPRNQPGRKPGEHGGERTRSIRLLPPNGHKKWHGDGSKRQDVGIDNKIKDHLCLQGDHYGNDADDRNGNARNAERQRRGWIRPNEWQHIDADQTRATEHGAVTGTHDGRENRADENGDGDGVQVLNR